ncbi:MAG: hypothetical protein AAFU77_00740 [Myxococcota bacterium]
MKAIATPEAIESKKRYGINTARCIGDLYARSPGLREHALKLANRLLESGDRNRVALARETIRDLNSPSTLRRMEKLKSS